MKIVLAHGCFDPFHIGHLHHLERSLLMGTMLTVSVTTDAEVTKQKGPKRPVFPAGERAEMLRALRIVSRVIVVDTLLEALQAVEPDILSLGQEYIGRVETEHYEYCKAKGIEIKFTRGPVYSATQLLRHYA